jgi:carbon dioxide concentrating mechanism protein CcmO
MEARESAIAKPSAPRQRSQPQPIVSESALGMVSTRSFPAIVGTADMMLKSSSVRLVGYEKIGSGYCTAVVRGRIADVRIAVEEGAAVAEQFGQFVPSPTWKPFFPSADA